MKHEHERELSGVLDVAPPQAYERGGEGKRAWWRRALELFGTFRRKQGLTREDVAEYRKQKAREELPVTDPERHLGMRVSRLEDMAKGLVVDGARSMTWATISRSRTRSTGPSPTPATPSMPEATHATMSAPTTCACSRRGGSRVRSTTGTKTRSTSHGSEIWSGVSRRARHRRHRRYSSPYHAVAELTNFGRGAHAFGWRVVVLSLCLAPRAVLVWAPRL